MPDNGEKYWRRVVGVKDGKIDVYSVCHTFTLNAARSHAVKKILMAGKRGVKNEIQDIEESITALEREVEILKGELNGRKKDEKPKEQLS